MQRLQAFIDKIRGRSEISDLQESWSENVLNFSFRTFGFTVQGMTTVDDDRVRMEGTLPMAALPFRGKIESTVHQELARMLQA